MGLKGKILGKMTSVAIEKVASSGKIDDAINNFFDKFSGLKSWGDGKNQLEIKRANYIVIKERSLSIKTMARIACGSIDDDVADTWGKYQVFDNTDSLKYTTEVKDQGLLSSLVFDKGTLYIFDKSEKQVARIEENLLSFACPFLEENAKRCTVYLEDGRSFEVKRYYCFKKLCYDIYGIKYSLTHTDGKDYKIEKDHEIIADIHSVNAPIKDDYVPTRVVEFDNKEDELVVMLLTLVLDIIKK